MSVKGLFQSRYGGLHGTDSTGPELEGGGWGGAVLRHLHEAYMYASAAATSERSALIEKKSQVMT